jgi:hypothetical protein
MPFTFSHPAIVLPLKFLPSRWFSLSGLVIGSITPDFEYFLRMRIKSEYSHTISGIFWFDLPLGILLAFLFHNVVRDKLIENLPLILSARFSKFKQFDWGHYFREHWFVTLISLLIGAVSHIFWDGFTHEHGYFVQTIPTLINTVEIFGIKLPTFKILQHSSTLLGALIIALAILRISPDKDLVFGLTMKYWVVLVLLTISIIGVRLLCGLDYKLYGHVIVTAISAGLISLVLTPIILLTFNKR